MPDIARIPIRFNCNGLNLVHPLDRMPDGFFPYLYNARVIQDGRLDGRPGYSKLVDLAESPNSIRQLNDPTKVYTTPYDYTLVGGAGSNLYAGRPGAYNAIDSGYSTDPLSLIPFRPENSPETWMYVYDKFRLRKVRPDSAVRPIGIEPPRIAPSVEYGTPAAVQVVDGQSSTGWTATGSSSSPSTVDRTSASNPTVSSILYVSGSAGWACVQTDIADSSWTGERMQVKMGDEVVVVREIHPAIKSTYIYGIQYDSGTTGMCSIVLVESPDGLQRNSLLQIGSETVRVLEVIQPPSGTGYSIRCSTESAHSANESVVGLLSWFCYLKAAHTPGESITADYVAVSQASAGTGSVSYTSNINASVANGRPVDPANDYLHLSVYLENPEVVTTLSIMLCIDQTAAFSFSEPKNSYAFVLKTSDLITNGASKTGWAEVIVPISSATRYGNDYTRNLATISGVAVQVVSTAGCNYGVSDLYLFGTYGPVIQPNALSGLVYQYRYRDTSTGAKSVPGPQNRSYLYPLRESVIITPAQTTQQSVDIIDIYRVGAAVTASSYVGSVTNDNISVHTYTDTLPDDSINKVAQTPDLTAFQPWPLLTKPISGIVSVCGTSVEFVEGDPFKVSMLSNTAIVINGSTFLTYGQPSSTTKLELTQSAGYQLTVPYQIASPTCAGQPLPFAFGPMDGPFAPVIFGLGDPENGGNLYFTNMSDADSASDKGYCEVSTPSSNLISGAVWNGLCFVGNSDAVYCIRYSYLTTIGASSNTTYQWNRVNAPSGMWSRWSCCWTPVGIAFLGRDGIYLCTETAAISLTDDTLYPLFPHGGNAAVPIQRGTNTVYPVDMTKLQNLRLSYCDESLRFCYIDTAGNAVTLIYEIYKKRWIMHSYADGINYHYLVERQPSNTQQQILHLSINTNKILVSGGSTDNGTDINTVGLTASMDGGDTRMQKLYVDSMLQAGGTGTINLAASYDNATSFSPVYTAVVTGDVSQTVKAISSLGDLSVHRNVGLKFDWVGGPTGPNIYGWDVAAYIQPMLTKRLVTQFFPFSFPGWKHMRRMYPALISNDAVTLNIALQDGRSFGPYTLDSTGGVYKVISQMLDHGIKDLAFALQLDGGGKDFAVFLSDFVVEVKSWTEETYILLAIFKA